MELINKYNFAKVALDKTSEMFVDYIAALRVLGVTETVSMPIHPKKANQVQVVTLQQNKDPFKIPPKYIDYTNVFSPNLAMELVENTNINKHVIELIEGK